DRGAQRRYQLTLEPGMSLEPRRIARRRVWQREVARRVLAPGGDRLGQRRLPRPAEVVALRIGANEKRHLDAGERGIEPRPPQPRALGTRRIVASRAAAGVAEP